MKVNFWIVVALAMLLINSNVMAQSTFGQSPICADWSGSHFEREGMRVCRVASYLFHSVATQNQTSWQEARENAGKAFIVCWGNIAIGGVPCNQPNAWASPSTWGKKHMVPIHITLAATEMLQSDDEVACVLAHEMGHALDADQTPTPSIQNEYRADGIGIGLVMKAGYDARSCGRALQMLTGERGQGLLGNLNGMLNQLTHPPTLGYHPWNSERIALMKRAFATLCQKWNGDAIGCQEGWK